MQKANTDTTYCVNEKCKNKCDRYVDNFEFEDNENYCFMQHCSDYIDGEKVMFKIKDGINLKELEKFGYDEYDDGDYLKTMPDDIHELYIHKTDKIIYVYTEISKRYAQEYEVKDLIQAGYVEKVGDNA